MSRRRKPVNFGRVLILLALIGGAVYFNQVIVPETPPLFIPTPTATRAPESYVTEAEALVQEGKLPQAIEAYQKAIQVDPKNAASYVVLSRLQIYAGDYAQALINAENALLLNPNNALALALRGYALGFQGNYLDGEGSLRQAIELEPNNAIAYAYLAEILGFQEQNGAGDLGTLDKAIDASRRAVELDANLLETHRARGLIYELTANYAEAAREFEAAIAQNANIADIHLALGRNYRALEQYDKAVEEFSRANALNPSDPLPDTYISRTYATVGEYAKAAQYAEQAIVDAPTDAYLYGNLGTMYYRNREYDKAIQSLTLAIRGGSAETGEEVVGLPLDYGRIAEYYSVFGLSLAKNSRCGEALQISQLLIQGVPNDETSIFNADEIVNICREILNTPQPTPEGGEETIEPAPEATQDPEMLGEATPAP
ncbi:MAG: tetratricopeptide repeat protein [Anaerolineae bacterium]|nr:tetratricopeptide repeat protein [Anaerolineae bacterium]